MNALNAILAANERGVLVTVTDDDKLYASPKEKLTPEIRAALRENKEEIVTGSKPPKERYQVLEMSPATNWYVIINDHSAGDTEQELFPLVAWARVFDHETGYESVEGLITGWEYEVYAGVASEIGRDASVSQYVYLQPDEAETKREEIECSNISRQPNTLDEVYARLAE